MFTGNTIVHVNYMPIKNKGYDEHYLVPRRGSQDRIFRQYFLDKWLQNRPF